MSGLLDSRADLRAAVRRLIAALRGTSVDVEVRRRDLELVMSLAAGRLYERGVVSPNLHPSQK